MRIDSIHLQNYRCFSELDVQFQPGMNVIAGVNGSGKTSLLSGVAEAFNWLFDGWSSNGLQRPVTLQDFARVIVCNDHGRYRFEQSFPVAIATKVELFKKTYQWDFGRSESAPTVGSLYEGPFLDRYPDIKQVLPVTLFYRSHRNWSQTQPSELQAATAKPSRLDGYQNWWDASADGTALQAWVIAKCLERFQTSSETGIAFDAITDDELALVNGALRQALPEIWGLRYDMKRKSLLVEWAGDGADQRDAMPFELLSDGQRTLIALLSDIARRMCLLNPQLGDEVIAKTPGVVLIDELDMHLHPEWQRRLTRGLKAAFPALQFIAASHSPQVLGELQPQEIILLRPEGVNHPQVSYGLDSSRVLEEIMGASARTPAVESAINELFASLERNELEPARLQLQALSELAPGIAELSAAKALLKRKEVLGR